MQAEGSTPAKAPAEGGITYELFCAAPVAGDGGRDAKLGELESKLAALERAVGSGSAQGSSISDSLAKLVRAVVASNKKSLAAGHLG